MKTFKEYQPQQMTLIPAHLSEWLPDDHPVHFINEVVELLDLSKIYQDYREASGKPPYHPKMMVKILIYAIAKRTPSSRKIEQALYDDIGFAIYPEINNRIIGQFPNFGDAIIKH